MGEFEDGSSDLSEAGATALLVVLLSEQSVDDVVVPFSTSGEAVLDQDYGVLTPSPLTIPAGQTSATIEVLARDDGVAFGDVQVSVDLETPTGGELGAQASHVITLLDDEVPIPELEDNDNISIATKNGNIATIDTGGVVSIVGSVVEEGDLFDVHWIQIPDDSNLRVTASFVGPHPDVLITLTDAMGVPYADDPDPDSVTFDVDPGRLYCVVQSTGSETSYRVRLVAEASP